MQFALTDEYRLASILKPRAKKLVDLHPNLPADNILLGSLTKNMVAKATNQGLNDQTRADLLRFEWEEDNRANPWASRITAFFMVAGAFIFLLPSMNVISRVIETELFPQKRVEEMLDKRPEFPVAGRYSRDDLSLLLTDSKGHSNSCSQLLRNNSDAIGRLISRSEPLTSSVLIRFAAATALGCDPSKQRWP